MIDINDNKIANTGINLNEYYGPYTTLLEAHNTLLENGELNQVGFTVGIKDNTTLTIEEYWYQGGTEQANLVKKQSSEVEANPAGEATTTLNKIKIGETNYKTNNPFAGAVDATDAERLQALANISNQEAGYDSSDPPVFTGKMGYVVLQPETDNKTTFAAQIANKPNTIFEIRDVFDLDTNNATVEEDVLVSNIKHIDGYWYYYDENTTINLDHSKSPTGELILLDNNSDNCLLDETKSSVIANKIPITEACVVYPAIRQSDSMKYKITGGSEVTEHLIETIEINNELYFKQEGSITLDAGLTITSNGCVIVDSSNDSILGTNKYKNEDSENSINVYIARKKSEFAERKWIIRPYYCIPSNCALKFNGGKIKKGIIKFQDTSLDGEIAFDSVLFSGDSTIVNDIVDVNWFGAKTGTDDLPAPDCQDIVNNILLFSRTIRFGKGQYRVSDTISLNAARCILLEDGASIVKDSGETNETPPVYANTNPVIELHANYCSIIGNSRTSSSIISKDHSPQGVVRLGFRDYYPKANDKPQINNCKISGVKLKGIGAKDDNIAVCLLYMFSPHRSDPACYFHLINDVSFESANIGIWMKGSINACQFTNLFFQYVGTKKYNDGGAIVTEDIVGVNNSKCYPLENCFTGIFHHQSLNATTLRIKNRFAMNHVYGLLSEVGSGTSTSDGYPALCIKETGGLARYNVIFCVDNDAGRINIDTDPDPDEEDIDVTSNFKDKNVIYQYSKQTLFNVIAKKLNAELLEATTLNASDLNVTGTLNTESLYIDGTDINDLIPPSVKKYSKTYTSIPAANTQGVFKLYTFCSLNFDTSVQTSYSYNKLLFIKLYSRCSNTPLVDTLPYGVALFIIWKDTNNGTTTLGWERLYQYGDGIIEPYEYTDADSSKQRLGFGFKIGKTGSGQNTVYADVELYSYTESDFQIAENKDGLKSIGSSTNYPSLLYNYKYTVTTTGTNVTVDNNATSVVSGSAYIAKLTYTTGYILDTISVKMYNGASEYDITNIAYKDDVIYIPNVTGNVAIVIMTKTE